MADTTATPVRRALLSVSDKTGIVEFARGLSEQGIELLSTGGDIPPLARQSDCGKRSLRTYRLP